MLTLATDDRAFPAALARLRQSLTRTGFDDELIAWEHGDLPEGSPAHDDVPFGFKPYAVEEARRRGFDVVLWLDAGCVAVRPLEPIFQRIERDGYVLFANEDRVVGDWAAPHAIDALGVTRAEAMDIPELNAAALGLDLRAPAAARFQELWLREARRGTAFRGHKSEHRHDQTVAGVLAARLGMTLLPRGLEPLHRGRRWVWPSTRLVVVRDVQPAELQPLERIERVRRLGPLVRF